MLSYLAWVNCSSASPIMFDALGALIYPAQIMAFIILFFILACSMYLYGNHGFQDPFYILHKN